MQVYITAAFRARHPRLAELVRACSLRPGSKWTVLDDKAKLNRALKAARRDKKGGQVMVLCLQDEAAASIDGVDPSCKRVTFHKFEKTIKRPDELHTVST